MGNTRYENCSFQVCIGIKYSKGGGSNAGRTSKQEVNENATDQREMLTWVQRKGAWSQLEGEVKALVFKGRREITPGFNVAVRGKK